MGPGFRRDSSPRAVSFKGGSGAPAGGQLGIMAAQVFRACRAAMGQRSQLLVIGELMGSGAAPGTPAHLDLRMLVIFGEAGLRTEDELRALLAEASLSVTHIVTAGRAPLSKRRAHREPRDSWSGSFLRLIQASLLSLDAALEAGGTAEPIEGSTRQFNLIRCECRSG